MKSTKKKLKDVTAQEYLFTCKKQDYCTTCPLDHYCNSFNSEEMDVLELMLEEEVELPEK